MSAAQATVAARPRRRSEVSERRLAAYLVSPSLIVIAIVAAYPICYAIWLCAFFSALDGDVPFESAEYTFL